MTASYRVEAEMEELRNRLQEALDTLEAIRNGEVDALVVSGRQGEKVYTLQGADERYRHLVEQMHQGALITSRDGMILYCNSRFSEMVRAPIEHLIGGKLHDFLEAGDDELVDLLEGPAAEYEADLRSADGVPAIPVFVTGRPLPSDGLPDRCIVMTDLRKQRATEERLKAQEALVKNEALLRLALRAARMGTWNIGPGGKVQCSESTFSLFGFPPDAKPDHLDAFVARIEPEDAHEVLSILSSDPGEHILTFRVRVDGQQEPRWLEWHCESMPARGSSGVMGTVLDVSHRVRVEKELRRANAAKDEFLGLVSHELRTPITTVAGLSRVLHRRAGEFGPEEMEAALAAVSQDADRLQGLIVNMLLLSRAAQESPPLEPLMLSHCIAEVVEDFQARIEGREVLLECAPRIPPALGHEPWVVQVMENLLSNADKYSPAGTPIEVKVEREGTEVCVSVRDYGKGIDPGDEERIFQPFERTSWARAKAPGLGLGLAVCRRLLDAQMGSIRVSRPEEGSGAKFCFTLPVADIT